MKVFAHEKYVINKSAAEELGFTPGTVTVTSGSTLTFTYGNKQTDPHTLTRKRGCRTRRHRSTSARSAVSTQPPI